MTRRTPILAVLAALVTLWAVPAAAAKPPAKGAGDGARAGVAMRDATWHVGASAGQFTDDTGPTGADGVDPHHHSTKKRISDGVALRTSTRALVVEGSNGERVAIVAHDLYLPQDLLTRRVASLLQAHDRAVELGLKQGPVTRIKPANLALTASHNHNTPYYSTPGWGTAIFQDVFDLRFYEYMARQMTKAVIEAAKKMVPVRMGAATRTFNEIQAHTYGPKVGDDGTPAGQPYDHTTKQLSVVRFDDISNRKKPEPLANWVVFGVHPEWTWGYDLINGDITHAAARMVDRELGTLSVFSQRETGTSGPHKDRRAHEPEERREFQDNGFGELDRGARLLADAIKATLRDIERDRPERESAYQPFVTHFDVAAVSQRFAPPATRPYPGVSNCNTAAFFHGDPRIPILGLPDCRSASNPVTQALTPATAPMYDQLKAAGVPIPESISPTKLTAVEETAAVHLQAMRFGGVVATFCPCEQFTDTALNIESRLDRLVGNVWKGFDWTDRKTPTGRDWCVPAGDGRWRCANPQNPAADLPPISDEAYRRFRAQIKNDATGWETDLATLGSESEPKDPAKIKGNFTHEEFPQHGYRLVLSVGMANDYWGYVPEYREYRSHDHYRKALSGLGPHGADFLATRLGRLGASLNGGPKVEPSALDLVFLAEQARAQTVADGLGAAAQAYTSVYARQLPADGGRPGIPQDGQPNDVTRFQAAHLEFVGGSNYTDLPNVRVQRRAGKRWVRDQRQAQRDGDAMTGLVRLRLVVACLAAAALCLALPAGAVAEKPSSPPGKSKPKKPKKPKKNKAPFAVGAAKRSTDPLPEHGALCLGGYGFCPNGGGRTMQGIHDPMYARALAIGRGKKDGLILVHTTNIGFFTSYKTAPGVGIYHLRQQVAERAGLRADQVIVQSDHSHAGPDTIGIWGGVPPAWIRYMQDQAVDAAVAAWRARRPARLYSGHVDGPGVESSYEDEPNVAVDERFHLVWANDRTTGERIATFANYSPHATVLGSGNKKASGDWPEWAAKMVEERFGGSGIAGVGTLGREDFGGDPATGRDKNEAVARERLDRMIAAATAGGREIKPGPVEVRSVYIQEPLAQPILALNLFPEDTLGAPSGVPEIGGMDVSIDREPAPPWFNAGTIGTYAGAARIGSLFLGMSPGEPFPQIQFYLREEGGITGARDHLHLGAANDFLGYMVRPVDHYPQVAKEGATYLAGCPEDMILGVTPIPHDGACTDHWTLMVSPTIGSHVACTIQKAGVALGFRAGRRAPECDALTVTDGTGAPPERAP